MSYNRHYCYSIVFEDGCTYFGVRTCQCSVITDGYMGSPKAYAAKWLTDMPRVKHILSVHASRRLANEAEAKLIADFWSVSKELSLNASIRGAKFSMLGRTHTVETKTKMSKSNVGFKGRVHTNETKVKLSEAGKGNKRRAGILHTDKTKAKLSEASKGRVPANKGIPHTAETRAKISEANKGRPKSDTHKANMSKAGKDKPKSAETRAKLSAARKGKKCYTNGTINVYLAADCAIPEGHRLGKTKRNIAKATKKTCQNCGEESSGLGYSVYHGDNCTSLTSYILATHLVTGETRSFKTVMLTQTALNLGEVRKVLSGKYSNIKGWFFERIKLAQSTEGTSNV